MRAWLRRFYLFAALQAFRLEGPVWILFLHARGLGLSAIGWTEVAYHLGGLAGQVPSGVFADRRGRHLALAAGGVIQVAGLLALLGAHALPAACGAMSLLGFGGACVSGADRGLLYAAVAAAGRTQGYQRLSGALIGLEEGAAAAGTAAGGAIAGALSFGAAFLGEAGLQGLAAVLALTLRQPAAAAAGPLPGDEAAPPRADLRTALAAAFSPRARWLTAYCVAYSAVGTCVGLWLQVVLADKGLRPAGVGVALAVCGLATAVGGMLGGRLRARAVLWIVPVAQAGGAVAVALLRAPWPVVATIVPAALAGGVLYPHLDAMVQTALPEHSRASGLSVQAALFSAAMIAAFPTFGALLGRSGPSAYLAFAPAWAALACAGVALAGRPQVTHAAVAAAAPE